MLLLATTTSAPSVFALVRPRAVAAGTLMRAPAVPRLAPRAAARSEVGSLTASAFSYGVFCNVRGQATQQASQAKP
eukprot:7716688-Lingulodinium_polyedra.AAC.1